MKNYLLILMAGLLFLTACNRNDEDFYPYEDEENFDAGDYDEGTTGDNDQGDSSPNTDSGEGELSLYKVDGNRISLVKDYNVQSNLKSFQDDKGKHQKMWDFTAQLIPISERDKIAEFEVFHGGGELLGYVLPIDDNDLSKWRFALAIDIADNLNTINFADLFTLVTIHEYGHILTLNDEQINVGGNKNSCSNYFTGEGCSTRTSYINELVKIGWKDIIDNHDQENPDATYNQYQDRFVSDYAATNPGEDIAEVFTYFVINSNPPPGNSIAEQKINLMYNYPELVQLRSDIRTNETVARMNSKTISKSMRGFRICGKRGCIH